MSKSSISLDTDVDTLTDELSSLRTGNGNPSSHPRLRSVSSRGSLIDRKGNVISQVGPQGQAVPIDLVSDPPHPSARPAVVDQLQAYGLPLSVLSDPSFNLSTSPTHFAPARHPLAAVPPFGRLTRVMPLPRTPTRPGSTTNRPSPTGLAASPSLPAKPFLPSSGFRRGTGSASWSPVGQGLSGVIWSTG